MTAPATRNIRLVQRSFTGGIELDPATGEFYRKTNDTEMQYVGEPVAETENAWMDLMQGMII